MSDTPSHDRQFYHKGNFMSKNLIIHFGKSISNCDQELFDQFPMRLNLTTRTIELSTLQ